MAKIGHVTQFLLLSLIAINISHSLAEIRVVCYYSSWAHYRPELGKFDPQNINPFLCTHIVYAFVNLANDSNLEPTDRWGEIDQGGYEKFNSLKDKNKNLKTLLAVGGWDQGSTNFAPMVADPDKRSDFIRNSIRYLRKHDFDGLSLHWLYPTFRKGGTPADKNNYAIFVQELRQGYEIESTRTGKPRLLLVMAVPGSLHYIEKGFDIPKLTKHLDWMTILSYDYHTGSEETLNHHTPLYNLEGKSSNTYQSYLNANYSVHYYLKEGGESDKLLLGIATYGRSYTLFNPDAADIGSPAIGVGKMGTGTAAAGRLSYFEICRLLMQSEDKWTSVKSYPNEMGPFAFRDDQWVCYDDEAMIIKKAEYAAQMRLGGIMFWSIDNDDFSGNCSDGVKFPLIEAGKAAYISAAGNTQVSKNPLLMQLFLCKPESD